MIVVYVYEMVIVFLYALARGSDRVETNHIDNGLYAIYHHNSFLFGDITLKNHQS